VKIATAEGVSWQAAVVKKAKGSANTDRNKEMRQGEAKNTVGSTGSDSSYRLSLIRTRNV
jgi:hypothetical protein